MTQTPTTRPSLLLRIRDAQDRRAWERFVELYAPLVYGHLRHQGLQDADAADLTQDVLRSVAGAIGRLQYDPSKGTFRGWLFTVVRNRLRNWLASRQRREQGAGDTAALERLEQQPAREDEAAGMWEREHRRHLLAMAAERVRGEVQEATWLAFWRTAVEGKSVRDVAGELGMTLAAVYLARSRVMARLKDRVRELEEE